MAITRADVRAFGQRLRRGGKVINRWQEHSWPPYSRTLTVVQDVPGRAFFILQDKYGRFTWMRTRTLLSRYARVGG